MRFITFVKINTSLPAAAKVKAWMSPLLRDVVEIESDVDTAHDAALRAMRLFSQLGELILVIDHTSVPAATARRDCVAMKLGTRLLPTWERPFEVAA